MTVKTILIINILAFIFVIMVLGFFMYLYYVSEKKVLFFQEKAKALSKELRNEISYNLELQSLIDDCEERVKAAYELGYKESKEHIIKEGKNG